MGKEAAEAAAELCLAAYARAAARAEEQGIVICDTKFELGFIDGELSLCDEVLTPDSSRFWPADDWAPGTNPPSFDKQPLRDWLEAQPWDKKPPPPALPPEIVDGHVDPVRGRLRAGLRAVAGRLVRCLTWPRPDSSRCRSRCGCVTASPTRRGPPSSGPCPPSASTG